MVIAYVVNNPDFLISHRLEVCLAAQAQGNQVHVICPVKSSISKLKDLGFKVHCIEFGRSSKNPITEIKVIYQLVSVFKSVKPDLVHLITIKPYLYGGIAARLAGVKAVVSAVAGLGMLFSSTELKYRLLRLGIYPLFKLAFGHKNQIVIFQNEEDRKALVNWRVVGKDQVRMIRGSGVDLTECPVVVEPEGVPIIAFAGRLLKDKGVEVFVEASRLLNERNIPARFWLIGEPDSGNANSVTQQQLTLWEKEGSVELFGFRKDIPSLFSRSNIVTLPSFYGEGLPKVLIEAAACGRPVITTDHPGCRDAIEPNKSGVLVPIKDELALADAIQYLIENRGERLKMGRAGRQLAEKEFSVEKVVDEHIRIYHFLMEGNK